MGYPQALFLALLQGLTEFLPVSSSGHLVLAQNVFGDVGQQELLYDVLLHLATAAAVIAYFRRDLAGLLLGAVRPRTSGPLAGQERRMLLLIALASVPTAILGLAVERYLEDAVTRPDLVGMFLIATGCLLWAGRGRSGDRGPDRIRPRDALAVGVVQGLAVLPGVSRSGSTITAAILAGIDRDLAVRFSLWISLPAILGATLLKAVGAADGPFPPAGPSLLGMAVAAVVGYLAIDWIVRLVRGDRFHWFAWYLWPLGAAAILWYHLG